LWKEAEAVKTNGLAQFTYLNKDKFYTISTLTTDTTQIYLTRIGANDPNFNLRPETSIVFRRTKQSPIFLSVLEMHGYYDTRNEFSYDSYSKVKEIVVLQQDDNTTVFKIVLNSTSLLLAVSNNNFDEKAKHNVTVSSENIQWTGPYHFKKIANK